MMDLNNNQKKTKDDDDELAEECDDDNDIDTTFPLSPHFNPQCSIIQ